MIRFILPVTGALLLMGCAAEANGPSNVSDSRWRFTSIDGAAPVSAKAGLSFAGDHLAANAGCNGLGGPWRVESGRLIAGPLIQTEMYCDGPVWGQEQAVSALLAGAPTLRVEGNRMSLKSSGHSAELSRLP
jgi:heat shock protein HslJ